MLSEGAGGLLRVAGRQRTGLVGPIRAGGGEGRAHGESIRNTGLLHPEMRDFEQQTGFPRFGWPGVIGHHA